VAMQFPRYDYEESQPPRHEEQTSLSISFSAYNYFTT